MSTHPTLTRMLVAAHAADLTDQARQARLARAARTSEGHPGRLRTSTARLLVGLAHRLDHRLGPIPAHAPSVVIDIADQGPIDFLTLLGNPSAHG